MKITSAALVIACLCVFAVTLLPALCWSNGGYSADQANPDYGTHDWIAQHALDYLPTQEKQYITDNLAGYLLGTELPDNSNDTIGGIGDTTKHHIYYSSAGVLIDGASALRANETFNQAITYLRSSNYAGAAKSAGTLTHYIADLAVFGHVMGASTDWGAEVHHSDYENYVDTRTNNYTDTFNVYLAYDGILSTTTAYTATINLAYDTTFGGSNHLNCTWMDTNYNWSSSVFSDRCGESLNLAVNAVADVLHSLYVQVYPPPTPSPTPTSTPTPIPSVTPTPTPSPTTTPTQASTPTPTPPPTATPVPTANPTPKPTTPTPQPTATPKPTSMATPSPTPTAPEFPAVSLLIAALIILSAAAVLCKKKPKKQTTI